MTWERNILINYQKFAKGQKVNLGDGCAVDAVGVGDVHVSMQFKMSQPRKCVFYQVLYVQPGLACNLFSVRAAAVTFIDDYSHCCAIYYLAASVGIAERDIAVQPNENLFPFNLNLYATYGAATCTKR